MASAFVDLRRDLERFKTNLLFLVHAVIVAPDVV